MTTIKIATVIAVQASPPTCKVQAGQLISSWIPWTQDRAGLNVRDWNPPSVGEEVEWVSPSDDDESGQYVGRSLFKDNANGASLDERVITFKDGASLTYNHSSGAMTVSGIKVLTVNASEKITLNTPKVEISGKTIVQGLLSYLAGMMGAGGAGGAAAKISGGIENTGGQITSNGIVLDTHKHKTNQVGGLSDPPQ